MENNFEPSIPAASAGAQALKHLSQNPTGKVTGITSAGIFLTLESSKVVFLSEQEGHGPLAIYLGQKENRLKHIQVGDVVVADDGLLFSKARVRIVLPKAGWKPPLPAQAPSPLAEQRERLARLARRGLSDREARGMGKYLPMLLGFDNEVGASQDEWQIAVKLHAVQEAADWKDSKLAEAVEPLLGLGVGLTPSGDDFVVGILLMMNRWQPELFGESLPIINETIARAARRRTTSLSASLIECAAVGEADSRLVNTADYIASGQPDEDTALSGLLSWGSSSGLDTLAGMGILV